MKIFGDLKSLRASCHGILAEKRSGVTVLDEAALQGPWTDDVVHTAVFGSTPELQGTARYLLKAAAAAVGIRLASIQGLYAATGRGEADHFTVPAMNIRGLSYDCARAFHRAARHLDCGAFIFEIARTEMAYTGQPPHEYVAVMLGAALREGFRGPLCIQGDHFQAKADFYFEDPDAQIADLRQLISDTITAGFYNIDIDSSTLVVLDRPGLEEQQKDNASVCASLTRAIRELEPEGIQVSVGGEIGEVGGHNSTVEEFQAFMKAYRRELSEGMAGISKISVQTGTSHGGVPLPDGSVADVKLDFDVLSSISEVARSEYGLAGTVQHGASTLPDEAFHHFPERGACEVHLATGFQNQLYDHPLMPETLRDKAYSYLRENFSAERKDGQTDEQFYYKTRKKAFGAEMKREWWNLPGEVREAMGATLEQKFAFLIEQLHVRNTIELMRCHVRPPAHPASLRVEIEAAGGTFEVEDDPDSSTD